MRMMLYFQVHQPTRLSDYRVFDIGQGKEYFDAMMNNDILGSVSRRCYIPAGKMLLKLLDSIPGFSFSMSMSGILLEQLEENEPEAYDLFRRIGSHERVELLSETYHHSLSSIFDKEEFAEQVRMHKGLMMDAFGKTPKVFRNTELIHSNDIDRMVKGLGFEGAIIEGCEGTLGSRSPYHAYESLSGLKLLPKASKLSDDIAFRFSNKDWTHWPLTPEKYHSWIMALSEYADMINICFDYETLGEHQGEETGILYFFESLIHMISNDDNIIFSTPSDLIRELEPKGVSNAPNLTSWADNERDVSAWLGNELQGTAASSLYRLKGRVLATRDNDIISDWRKLQTSDHFYYMSTKNMLDGSVHRYFSPYESPYDAFMRYMNVLEDFRSRIEKKENTADTEGEMVSL